MLFIYTSLVSAITRLTTRPDTQSRTLCGTPSGTLLIISIRQGKSKQEQRGEMKEGTGKIIAEFRRFGEIHGHNRSFIGKPEKPGMLLL
jgi:hypothetical protein